MFELTGDDLAKFLGDFHVKWMHVAIVVAGVIYWRRHWIMDTLRSFKSDRSDIPPATVDDVQTLIDKLTVKRKEAQAIVDKIDSVLGGKPPA